MAFEKRKEKIARANFFASRSDARPNDLTFKCIDVFIIPALVLVIILYFSFAFFGKSVGIHVPDLNVTTHGLICTLVIFIVASVCGKIMDHSDPRVKYILVILSVICVTLLQTFMTYIMVLTAVAPLLIASQYSDNRTLIMAFVLSLASSVVIVFLGYRVGLCDANMVFSPLKSMSSYTELSSEIKPISEVWKDLVVLFVLPRFILLYAFSMLIRSVVSNHNVLLENEVNIQNKSEHDVLTGLYNRVHYENALDKKYTMAQSVIIMFFDVNNLKFVNDTKGHDQGDRLIIKAAESLKIMSDMTMDVYRFGGDEFLAVVTDCTEADIELYIKKWKRALRELNSVDDELPCEIACGYAFGEGKDFSKLLREADVNMYNNKMEMKRKREI